jgi:hypothetical protein
VLLCAQQDSQQQQEACQCHPVKLTVASRSITIKHTASPPPPPPTITTHTSTTTTPQPPPPHHHHPPTPLHTGEDLCYCVPNKIHSSQAYPDSAVCLRASTLSCRRVAMPPLHRRLRCCDSALTAAQGKLYLLGGSCHLEVGGGVIRDGGGGRGC